MSTTTEPTPARRQGRRRGAGHGPSTDQPPRSAAYRQLRNPFPLMSVFSDDETANMHATALRTLEELGMRVLLPQARKIYAAAGARVVDDMV